jgi:hypothetical protein
VQQYTSFAAPRKPILASDRARSNCETANELLRGVSQRQREQLRLSGCYACDNCESLGERCALEFQLHRRYCDQPRMKAHAPV